MNELRILGINVTDRIKEAGNTQKVLSDYAGSIKTRLGFHELSEEICSRNAYIILQLMGDPKKWDELEKRLNTIDGLNVCRMNFKY